MVTWLPWWHSLHFRKAPTGINWWKENACFPHYSLEELERRIKTYPLDEDIFTTFVDSHLNSVVIDSSGTSISRLSISSVDLKYDMTIVPGPKEEVEVTFVHEIVHGVYRYGLPLWRWDAERETS